MIDAAQTNLDEGFEVLDQDAETNLEFEVLTQETEEPQEQPQAKPVPRAEVPAVSFNYENFKALFLDRYKKTTVAIENEGSKINLAIQEVNKYLPPKIEWEYYLGDATNPIFPLAGAVKTLTNLKTDIEILQGKQIEGLKKDCEQMFGFADRVMAERDQFKRIVVARESQFKERFEMEKNGLLEQLKDYNEYKAEAAAESLFKEQYEKEKNGLLEKLKDYDMRKAEAAAESRFKERFEKEKNGLLEQLKDYNEYKAEAEAFRLNIINVPAAYEIISLHRKIVNQDVMEIKTKIKEAELEARADIQRDRKDHKIAGVGAQPIGNPVVSVEHETVVSNGASEPGPVRQRGRPAKKEMVENEDTIGEEK